MSRYQPRRRGFRGQYRAFASNCTQLELGPATGARPTLSLRTVRSPTADARVVKSMAKKPTTASNKPTTKAFSAVDDALKDSVFNLNDNVDERTPHPQLRENPQRS